MTTYHSQRPLIFQDENLCSHLEKLFEFNSALSELPSSDVAAAGVRIGLIGDKFIFNPTTKEMEQSKLDLLLAGTDSAILMIKVNCHMNLIENSVLIILHDVIFC